MNVDEGARRMQQAGRWMVFIPLTIAFLFIACASVAPFLGASGSMTFNILPLLFFLSLPGAALWLAGWIVEGFAQRSGRNDH
jgi:hypothetical protein